MSKDWQETSSLREVSQWVEDERVDYELIDEEDGKIAEEQDGKKRS